jgi:ATP-dependent RNA helicase DHX37/DHR1
LKGFIYLADFEAEEIDLGGSHEDDLSLDAEGRSYNEKDADVDALDTEDEAEDQALGIDTEESDGELLVSRCRRV